MERAPPDPGCRRRSLCASPGEREPACRLGDAFQRRLSIEDAGQRRHAAGPPDRLQVRGAGVPPSTIHLVASRRRLAPEFFEGISLRRSTDSPPIAARGGSGLVAGGDVERHQGGAGRRFAAGAGTCTRTAGRRSPQPPRVQRQVDGRPQHDQGDDEMLPVHGRGRTGGWGSTGVEPRAAPIPRRGGPLPRRVAARRCERRPVAAHGAEACTRASSVARVSFKVYSR